MAQKTNFNINPYFDDFDAEKNFYKVLFNPGRPIQSRELNTIQSILQNQIESFGSHVFKEGSKVIPGSIHYDSAYSAVKVNPTSFGIEISQYIDKFIGKRIQGQASGLRAVIKNVVLPNNDISDITLYVKYLESGDTLSGGTFIDGESLLSTEDISYGINNVIITAGSPFASLLSSDATATGSAVSIDNGIYFIRGSFVSVLKQTLILDYYSKFPSYRVGLNVNEKIVTAKSDKSLYDNAKGFNNFSSPGADRFQIELTLTKKPLGEYNDTNFVELLRVRDGVLEKIQEVDSNYNKIRDYLAKRTHDESGNYTVEPFDISVNNSLNDYVGNNGKYFEGDTTSMGNDPSDDMMCVTLGPGKAYVKGYDITKTISTVIDVPKTRDTATIDDILVPFDMGNILRVNNVYGSPTLKNTVTFYDRRRGSNSAPTAGSESIGDAKVYTFKVSDSAYSNNTTPWDIFLYDINFYTEFTLGASLSSSQIKGGSRVVGQSSGAIGYAISDGDGTTTLKIRVDSGRFVQNEVIHIDGVSENKRSIKSLRVFTIADLKSVYDSSGTTNFFADSILDKVVPPGYSFGDTVSIVRVDDTEATLKSTKGFTGISSDTIVRYNIPGETEEIFNRVSAVNEFTLTLVPTDITAGVNLGRVPSGTDGNSGTIESVNFRIGSSSIKFPERSYLYSLLPNSNLASVDLEGSQLTFTSQAITNTTVSGNTLSISTTDFTLPGNSGNIKFDTFDPEKYSIIYADGTIQRLVDGQVIFSNNFTTATFNNIANKTLYAINATFIKSGIQSKTKVYKQSETLDVSLSKYERSGTDASSSNNDGLTYNRFYGLRVQDEEICLRYPDVVRVVAVYEAIDSDVTFDTLNFSSLYSVGDNILVGERVRGLSSNAVAQVVDKTTNGARIVHLNTEKFQLNEEVIFETSDLKAVIESTTPGSYKDITSSFNLEKGHKDEYYDYSRLVRVKGQPEPSRKLKVVFDRYHLDDSDVGDVYTVSSYISGDYGTTIPNVGKFGVRASDILDFRPRVTYFSGSTTSPFSENGRLFGSTPKVIITPNQASIISYDVYLPRIDKLFLDPSGAFAIEQGVPSLEPKQPKKNTDVLELASMVIPAYVYDTSDIRIDTIDNRRYTMRDIGSLETRISNLEEVTSLSLLEVNTQTLQIRDADGLDRFKTGFFADSFSNSSLINQTFSRCEVDLLAGELTPVRSQNVIPYKILTKENISSETFDSSKNYELLDSRVKKSGQVVTLDYNSVDWHEQVLATRSENVNPFHVIQYVGDIRLNPFRDIWVRTVQLSDNTIRHTLSLNLESNIDTQRTNLHNAGGATAGDQGLGENQFRDTFLNLNMATTSIDTQTTTSSDRDIASSTERTFIDSKKDLFMRSRNTQFSSSNLKAFTRYYPFLDGFGNIDITPKLVEVTKDILLTDNGTNGVFEVGERIQVWNDGNFIMSFRLAASNHKSGPYDDPILTYDVNPYNKNEVVPSGYNQSSTILNIDTLSLSDDGNGELYGGYLVKRALLIGESSQSTAYVKDIRLVSDNYGDIIGTFFIRDPNAVPAPPLRVSTGSKTFKLSSSPQNSDGVVGSNEISSAEATYVSEGTVNSFQNTIRITDLSANLTTNNNIRTQTLTATRGESIGTIDTPTPIQNFITQEFNTTNVTNVTNITRVTNNINQITEQQRYRDPLAQTFIVGNTRTLNSLPDGNGNDEKGAFLTGLDLYFQTVDPGNAPVTIQIRTTEFGTPTLTVIGDPVTLRPTDRVNGTTTILRDNVSTDGTVATHIDFPYPIFLPPNDEYAIVLLAPESDEYRVFTARMGEKTLNTSTLPDVESVRYTRQFAIGSLFKSQNGSTWTADQYEDLKFKLYKAEFTESEGILYLGNADLSRSNSYERNLTPNPLTILPRKLKVGIDTITDAGLISTLSPGRKIGEAGSGAKSFVSGIVESRGSQASGVGIDTGGSGYSGSSTNVSTFNITGNGSGLTVDLSVTSGTVTGATVNSVGRGYQIGDVVGITTSGTGSLSGNGARLSVTADGNSIDTLYITQAPQSFTVGKNLAYYDGGSSIGLGLTNIVSSATYDGYYTGDYMKVNHFDHGMNSSNNVLKISGVTPDTSVVKMTSDLSRTAQAISIDSNDISKFETFEGQAVSSTNPGYLVINNELVTYTSATGSEIGGVTRGTGGTVAVAHASGSSIQKYEVGGVSLRRINTIHDIADTGLDLDSYYIKVPSGATNREGDDVGLSRSIDSATYGQILSFNSETSVGGGNIFISENVIYDTVNPLISAIIPGASAQVTAQVRTITATSVSGSEVSFVDQPYTDVVLNRPNNLNSLRMIASKPNADEFLTDIPRNRSSILGLRLATADYKLSPMVFIDNISAEYSKHRINNPISDYVQDNRTASISDDPHEAMYISKTVRLQQPSNTLRVLVNANRSESADFRVMYSLIRPEVRSASPNFEMFPGYDNLGVDLDTDGYLDVLDPSKNSGLPDVYTPSTTENQFLQHEYTAANVGPFIGFTIKIVMSSTEMNRYPRFQDIRAIALA